VEKFDLINDPNIVAQVRHNTDDIKSIEKKLERVLLLLKYLDETTQKILTEKYGKGW